MGSETGKSSRNAERQANTAELMSNIMAPGAGEISKKREKELQEAQRRIQMENVGGGANEPIEGTLGFIP